MTKFRFWDSAHYKEVWSDTILKLSPSDINMANQCEYKLYYKLTLPKVKKVMNEYLAIGKVFHTVLERNFKYKADSEKDLTWFNMEKILKDEWERIKKDVKFTKFTDEESYLKAKNYLKVYHRQRCPFIFPRSIKDIEVFFSFKATRGEYVLNITGKADLIDRSGTIIDHKTSKSKWSQEEADKEIQAYLYPLGLQSLGKKIIGFQFSVVSGVQVDIFPVIYDPMKANEILTRAFNIQQTFTEDNILMPKSKRYCKYCDFKENCKVINLEGENE